MKFKSCAEWPKGTFDEIGNYSDDLHGTKEQALAVCRLLNENGAGGDRKAFPLKTWVQPVLTFHTMHVEMDGLSYLRIVAFDDALFIGTVDVMKEAHRANFRQLYVVPSHRRQRVGTVLLMAVMKHAEMWGSVSVICGVRKDNLNAMKFYRRQGFSLTEEDGDDWLMLKVLGLQAERRAA